MPATIWTTPLPISSSASNGTGQWSKLPSARDCASKARRRAMKRCNHLSEIRNVHPHTAGCEECLKTGDTWVHLRLCMECGHVGCCDSSKNRHATKHFQGTRHPIMRSVEPGETWGWCYIDQLWLEGDWPIEGPRHHSPAADEHLAY